MFLFLNPFSTNVPLLYPLKTTENLRVFYVFKGYKSRTLVGNGFHCCKAIVFGKSQIDIHTACFSLTQLVFTCSNLTAKTLRLEICEICSKLTIKTPERGQWRRSGVFLVSFEHVLHLVIVFLLLTLNI